MSHIDTLVQLFEDRGNSRYGAEAVSQLEHALQAATLAEQAHSPPELIIAALLHDVGHLLHHLPDEAPSLGVDDHHETSGDHYLRKAFPPAVCEPVRLHVASKRYLCTTEPGYEESLSEPSRVSLKLQGGRMNPHEVKEFAANPFAEAAIQLRKWDDQAKVPKLETPSFDYFVPYLTQLSASFDSPSGE